MTLFRYWAGNQGEHELAAAGDLSVNGCRAHASPDVPPDLAKLDFEPERVTRDHLALEADLVDAGKQGNLPGMVRIAQHRNRAGLGNGLDDEDTGHDRIFREMPLEELLIRRDLLDRHRALSRIKLDDPINQQKRIPVWDDPANSDRVKRKFERN